MNEITDEAVLLCEAHAGGCGKRYRYAEVKHLAVPTLRRTHPTTGQRVVARAKITCPACKRHLLVIQS
jgi:hypothetical protein